MSKEQQGISYDVNTIPEGMDFETMNLIMKEQGIVFYDGSKGLAPNTIQGAEELEFIDTTSKEGKEILNKINK